MKKCILTSNVHQKSIKQWKERQFDIFHLSTLGKNNFQSVPCLSKCALFEEWMRTILQNFIGHSTQKHKYTNTQTDRNKLAKLRRHASRIHFALIYFGKIHFKEIHFGMGCEPVDWWGGSSQNQNSKINGLSFLNFFDLSVRY